MLKKNQHLIGIRLKGLINKRGKNKKEKVLELDGKPIRKIILIIEKISIHHFRPKIIHQRNIKVCLCLIINLFSSIITWKR